MHRSEKKIFQHMKKLSLEKILGPEGGSFWQIPILLLLHIKRYFAKDYLSIIVWPESNKD